ncbi:MAG: phage holin family protein [Sulfurimonas sp.]|uniref:phage holin family protein n=1 Tax=Sulfurimonas sp. TaxID=2022749 RepID=UPI0026316E14|nr:phage holin family protein [Sulfurimonas sp.]MDD2651670.1 phage holin family protein [Sulfurimonas sp.]MDD3451481.1 phage holin family protein [Sulfurimonas sp.]
MIAEGTTASIYAKVLFNFFTVCVGGILTYLGLNVESFFLFAMLLLIDYITGVAKAFRLNQCITSNRMKYGILSKLSLLLIPLVLAIGAKAVGADFKTVLLVGVNILVLSEVYSIIGNIYSIRTKDELPEYDVVAMLGKRIRAVLLRYSDKEEE